MPKLIRLIAAPALAVCLSAPAHPVAAAGAIAHVPRVFQITPARVNPANEPNIMLVGQNLTPNTQVLVGGRLAVTVEATGTTLLARLPEGLANGSYPLEVSTDGASTTASDPVVIEEASQGLNQSTMIAGGAFAALFLLIVRLARPRRYAWSR